MINKPGGKNKSRMWEQSWSKSGIISSSWSRLGLMSLSRSGIKGWILNN